MEEQLSTAKQNLSKQEYHFFFCHTSKNVYWHKKKKKKDIKLTLFYLTGEEICNLSTKIGKKKYLRFYCHWKIFTLKEEKFQY